MMPFFDNLAIWFPDYYWFGKKKDLKLRESQSTVNIDIGAGNK